MLTKGIILAGGLGTRLRPMTYLLNKHLLPVYDKPMVYYPIETLKAMGIKEILIISGSSHLGKFTEILGEGNEFGVDFTFKVQNEAGGIAQALGRAESFVRGEEQFAVILGDNIFEHPVKPPKKCGIVFKEVEDPKGLGVLHEGKVVEKPKEIISKLAQTGLYFYTPEVFTFIKNQKPSARGELEITDLNNWCLENLETEIIEYKGYWADAGTFNNLLSASMWIKNKIQ